MTEIGPTLRDARMRARIDITEVEQSTKIRAKYLRAIENEEWDLLPGPVYIRSFLRTYGDYLGLDSRLLVDEFKRRYERPLDHDRPLAAITRDRAQRGSPGDLGRGTGRSGGGGRQPRRFSIRGQWLVIGVVIVAIAAALWVIGRRSGKNHNGGPASVVIPAGTTHNSSHKRHKTVTKKKPKHHQIVATKASLSLVPTGSVWVCIETSAKKILVGGATYSPGEKIPPVSGRELLVELGNGDVTAKVNGKPYTVAKSASAIGLEITAKGVKSIANGPTCTT